MKDIHDGVNQGLPIESGIGGRFDRDQTEAATTDEDAAPRDDAAEATRDRAGAAPRLQNSTEPDADNYVGSRSASDTSVVLPDGGVVQSRLTADEIRELRQELTKFQTRVLAILSERDRYGLAIKRELEDYYGEDVNHGRLYPNLDTLEDLGLIEISELDKRTNNYALTAKAQAYLEDDLGWLDDRVNGGEE